MVLNATFKNISVILWQSTLLALCDKCDRSVIFSGIPVSSTNKVDCHNITEIFLKVALSTINKNKDSYDL
jgi:hypothetical protein